MEGHVVIVDTRPIEKPPWRCSRCAQRIWCKERCVEIRFPVARVMVDPKVSRSVVRQVDADGIDPIILHVYQGAVTVAGKRHGQSGCKPCYSGDRPTLRPTVRRPEKLVDGQLVIVADDKVVLDVEGRNYAVSIEIDREST